MTPKPFDKNLSAAMNQLQKLHWKNFLMLIVSTLINTVGVGFFLVAGKLIDGGFSGTSILFNYITTDAEFYKSFGLPEIPISVFLLVLNIQLFLFVARKIGFNFMI